MSNNYNVEMTFKESVKMGMGVALGFMAMNALISMIFNVVLRLVVGSGGISPRNILLEGYNVLF